READRRSGLRHGGPPGWCRRPTREETNRPQPTCPAAQRTRSRAGTDGRARKARVLTKCPDYTGSHPVVQEFFENLSQPPPQTRRPETRGAGGGRPEFFARRAKPSPPPQAWREKNKGLTLPVTPPRAPRASA